MPPSKHPGHFPSSDATAISNKEMRSSMVSVDAASRFGEKSQNCAELVVSCGFIGAQRHSVRYHDWWLSKQLQTGSWSMAHQTCTIKHLSTKILVSKGDPSKNGSMPFGGSHPNHPKALDEVGTSASMCQWLGLWLLPVPNEKPLCNKQTRPRSNQEVQWVQVPQTDSTRTFSAPISCFLASDPFFHLAASPVAAAMPDSTSASKRSAWNQWW